MPCNPAMSSSIAKKTRKSLYSQMKSSSVVCLHFSGITMFQGRTSKEQLAKMSNSVVYEWAKLSEEFLIGSIKDPK
ncbi:hypothetical protein E2C01_053509 [Portunus trituberculatus]|uniref:Uncharacterized protein n=1 Tax=Portunus trituberculatus TaxID=210409 RepID=A0A5B7GPD9_PORTR|nr:hypothetical protein [Portunus trituberculatus]